MPALQAEDRADVVVVGLGGSGLAAIHRLLDAGLDVVGVDAGRTPGEGAAGRNGGFLLAGLADFHHRARARFGGAAADLYRLTLEAMDVLQDEAPDLVDRVGSLRVEDGPQGEADLDAHAAALSEDGLPGSRRRDGLWIPTDGVMDPYARVQRLASRALQRGARLYGAVDVARIASGAVASRGGPSVEATAILVCVDGRLGALLPSVGGIVRTVRLQMLATAPTSPVASCAVYARGGLDYWQQRPDGRLFLGGARDVGGPEEETERQEPSTRVQHALDRRLRALGIEVAVTHRWAGLVGYTGSGLPFVGPVADGVWAAGGYCGTGNVVGWLAGRSLAHAVLGEADPFAAALEAARRHVSPDPAS